MYRNLLLILLLAIYNPAYADYTSDNNIVNTDKIFIVGTSPDYPPFEFIQNNKIVGFDIDLAQEIANDLKQDLIINSMDFNALIPALNSGKIDAIMAGMSYTPERSNYVDFSIPYFVNKLAIVSRENNQIYSTEDFADKTIGIQLGTSFTSYVTNLQKKYNNMKIVQLAKNQELLQELKAGRIDAVILDTSVVPIVLTSDTYGDFVSNVIEDSSTTNMSIAFRKNSSLVTEVNQILVGLQSTGEIDRLQKKWFSISTHTTDQTPNLLYIVTGMFYTLTYAVVSFALGFCLAIPLAMAKFSNYLFLRNIANIYTSIFQGTPLLVQLSIVYFALPSIGINISGFTAAIITFSLNSSAYVSEIIYGGIIAIDKGQLAAAKVLNIPYHLTMRDIILPQVIRNVLPSLLNETIDLLKESSLVSIIGQMDIMLEPKNALVKQYERLFDMDHIKLTLTQELLDQVVDKALKRKTGARGLRAILENILLEIMFESPGLKGVSEIILDDKALSENAKPKILYKKKASVKKLTKQQTKEISTKKSAKAV